MHNKLEDVLMRMQAQIMDKRRSLQLDLEVPPRCLLAPSPLPPGSLPAASLLPLLLSVCLLER